MISEVEHDRTSAVAMQFYTLYSFRVVEFEVL